MPHVLKSGSLNLLEHSGSHRACYGTPFFIHILEPEIVYWLRRCVTSQTVPGSIPRGVTEFFSDIFPPERTVALGSTQPLVKMSTRDIPGGKGSRCVRLTTSPPSRAACPEIWEPKPPGTLWVTPGLLRDSFFYTHFINA